MARQPSQRNPRQRWRDLPSKDSALVTGLNGDRFTSRPLLVLTEFNEVPEALLRPANLVFIRFAIHVALPPLHRNAVGASGRPGGMPVPLRLFLTAVIILVIVAMLLHP